jgi:membrane protein required for colicin V production
MSPATLDLCVAGLVLAFAVSGALSGALRQLVQVAALVAGWLAANAWGGALAEAVFGARALPWQRALSGGLCFAAALVAVGFIGRFLAARVAGPGGKPRGGDRGLGALLGAVKGGLLGWLLLSVLIRVNPLELGSFRLEAGRSELGSLAARHDLLGAILPRQARGLDLILEALRDPAARERLIQSDPGLKKLLEDPRLKPLLEQLAGRPGQPGPSGPPEHTRQDQSALEELLGRLKGEAPGK